MQIPRSLTASNPPEKGGFFLLCLMTKFQVRYSNWTQRAECIVGNPKNGDTMKLGIPADMWEDWEKALAEGRNIEDTLMYKRINPNVPARGRHAHAFKFEIVGEGVAPHCLSDQNDRLFTGRWKTKSEQLFTDWFNHLCKQKFGVTPKWPKP